MIPLKAMNLQQLWMLARPLPQLKVLLTDIYSYQKPLRKTMIKMQLKLEIISLKQ